MPRVSVLMPTHNRADVVSHAIQSVLDQTESDFELLVVADGCTDKTVPLVAGIRDPRIRLFDLPKAPYYGYANRNIALREARGEFVAFAAHDDLLFPDHLALLLQALDATGRDWIYSRPLWVSTDGFVVPYGTNLTYADELEWFLTVGNSIPASCVMHRRSCFDRYGYWPEDVPAAADWRQWIHIIEGGQRRNFGYLATPTCLHFSATWKQSRHSSMGEVHVWLEIADASPWWPAPLRYAIPDGTPEQQVLASAMRAAGSSWSEDIRAAVAQVLDRLAWDDIRDVRPRLRAAREENQYLREQAADAALEVARLRSVIAAADAGAADERAALDDARETLATLQSEQRTIRDELTVIRHHLSLVLASTSWRITTPMRNLKRLMNHVRR